MHRDDLLSQIRIRARLHGRNEARRVLEAVLHALQKIVPAPTFDDLTAQLPTGLDVAPAARSPARDGPVTGPAACRRLIHDVAEELRVDEPDAAFYTRITLGQLNGFCHGVTPAQIAETAPAALRPLLCARTDEPAHRYQRLVTTLGSAVTTLSLRAADPAPRAARTMPDPAAPPDTSKRAVR